MNEQACGEQYKVSKICIDGYKDCVLEGRIYQYNSDFNEGICFHSTIEFLKHMEQIMEQSHYPNYQGYRAFQQTKKMKVIKPLPEAKERGKKGTFIVKLLFRQHTSWQGTVRWCEGEQEISFRSGLELLFLMDSAVKDNEGF